MDVQHHRQADHLWRTIEIAKRIWHPQTLRGVAGRLKLICFDTTGRACNITWDGREIAASDYQVLVRFRTARPRRKIFDVLRIAVGSDRIGLAGACRVKTLVKRA